MFMEDFPDGHNGNIVGLAEKSIRWHRDHRREMTDRTIQKYGDTTEVARPTIPLPEEPGIRFLETVGEICDEAEEMEHCVASYARDTIRGTSFLFHVNFGGETATVEVGPSGTVYQAVGPKNRDNAAVAAALKKYEQVARSGENTFPSIFEAVKAHVTPGELAEVQLRVTGGWTYPIAG